MKRQHMDERAWTPKEDYSLQLPHGLVSNSARLLVTRKITWRTGQWLLSSAFSAECQGSLQLVLMSQKVLGTSGLKWTLPIAREQSQKISYPWVAHFYILKKKLPGCCAQMFSYGLWYLAGGVSDSL